MKSRFRHHDDIYRSSGVGIGISYVQQADVATDARQRMKKAIREILSHDVPVKVRSFD
jgi:hypothetical protein